MIEYGLIFGLGFLAALLVGLLLAPAIHARIVKFTENRILATVPISTAELRAQKDMVRAEMAMQVARIAHEFKLERENAVALTIARDGALAEAARLRGEAADSTNAIDELQVEAAELRSALRNEEIRRDQLRETVAQAQHNEKMKETRIDELLQRAHRLTVEIDNYKIELATRDTEAEGLRVRLNGLRDERETLRKDLKVMTDRAKDAELKLARELNRANRLEEKLGEELASRADKEALLDRRADELGRLRDRVKSANSELRENTRPKRIAKDSKSVVIDKIRPVGEPANVQDNELADTNEAPHIAVEVSRPHDQVQDTSALIDDVREQSQALSNLLMNGQADTDDDELRERLAGIGARMVAVVAKNEGLASPIRNMISGKGISINNRRKSLAQRARELLQQD